MVIEVEGASGTVGSIAAEAVDGGVGADAAGDGPPVRVLATPPSAWGPGVGDGPTVAPALRATDAAAVTVGDAGWFGGIGTLLAAVAVREAGAARALHVAYGLPGGVRAWRAAGPTLRSAVVHAAVTPAVARVEGGLVAEPLAAGRRLAWFPRPVGPAHAVAVGGLEIAAFPDVPTVRTWLAVGSLRAELLQAFGRADADGVVVRLLRRLARRGPPAATGRLRWAVVAEVLDEDEGVVRAWANGTDPSLATGALLAAAAQRLARRGPHELRPSSVVQLADPGVLLDEVADRGVLRWAVARPIPSSR